MATLDSLAQQTAIPGRATRPSSPAILKHPHEWDQEEDMSRTDPGQVLEQTSHPSSTL